MPYSKLAIVSRYQISVAICHRCILIQLRSGKIWNRSKENSDNGTGKARKGKEEHKQKIKEEQNKG